MSRPTDGSPDPGSGPAPGSGAGPASSHPAGDEVGAVRPASGFGCDLCGGSMLDRHCKLLCLSCGYQRDCSDP